MTGCICIKDDVDQWLLTRTGLLEGDAACPIHGKEPQPPAPRPVVDREALAKALHDAACGCDHYGHIVEIDDHEAADAVLALLNGGAK